MAARLNLSVTLALSLAATFVIAGGVAARAASRAPTYRPPATRCPKRNRPVGRLIYSDWEFPDDLNPYQTTSATSVATINFVQDTLVYWDQHARIRPQLLRTMPTQRNGGLSRDGKTLTLTLKPGLRWSDGAELTAQDLKFSWQIAMDPLTGLCPAIGCDLFTRVVTRGRDTVIIHLKRPYAAVDSAIAFPIMPHVWPGAWTDDPHAAAQRLESPTYTFEDASYPSNGAYQVTQFSNDDRIVLKPMTYYDDMSCGGYFQTVIFSFYSSKAAMIAAAAAKQTDLTGLGGGYTAADLPLLESHKGSYKLSEVAGFSYDVLELNHDATYHARPNPLANTRVRLALALAVDKLGLMQSALHLTAHAAHGLEAWTPWVNTPTVRMAFADRAIDGQWDPLARRYLQPGTGRALADARKLLAETPWRHGFSLDLYTVADDPVRQAQEAVIAQNWSRLGVDVDPFYVQTAQLFGDWDHHGILAHGAFQVAMHGFSTSPEPDGNKTVFESQFIDRRKTVHSAVNQNYSGIDDPLLDRAFAAAGKSLNPAVRRRNYYAIQRELNQHADWIMLYFNPVIITYNSRLYPVYNNPTFCQVTCNAWVLRMSR